MSVTYVEALIAVCVARGDWADLGELPEAERVVAASFIRRVLTATPLTRSEHGAITEHQPNYAPFYPAGDFAPVPVAAPGVRLRRAVIAGQLDLSNCAGPGDTPLPALALEECRLLGRADVSERDLQDDRALMCLDLCRASIASVSLKDSAFTYVAMFNARIEGALDLSGVKPLAGWMHDAFDSGRMAAFRGAMLALRADLKVGPGDTETRLDRVRADPPALHPHNYCWLDLSGSHIQGSVLAHKVMLRVPRRDREGMTDVGRPPRFALRLEAAVVAGTLDARGGSVFDGGLSLYLAEIRDEVWLGGGRLVKEQGVALDAQGARLGGIFAIAAPPLRILGTVFLNSVRISGHFKLQAADIDGDGGAALMVGAATIGGDVTLGAGAAIRGPVELSGTSIGGTLDLRGAILSGAIEREPAGSSISVCCNAIHGRNLSVGADAYLSDGFIADGCVWLSGARIGDDLDLRGATLAGEIPNQYQGGGGVPHTPFAMPEPVALAMSASDIAVGGSLRIGGNRPSARMFAARGTVNLQRASVGKDLDIINASIARAPSSPAEVQVLDLGWCSVSGTLILSANQFDGAINLEHASTNILCDDESGYGAASSVSLNGLSYEGFYERDDGELASLPDLVETRKTWLERMPHYRPQPYANLARILMRDGRPDEARDILVEKYRRERGERVRGLSPALFFKRPGEAVQSSLLYAASAVWGLMFGYGLKPSRAIGTLLCAFLVGWAFFAVADAQHAMVIDQQPIAGYVQGDKMGGALLTTGEFATGLWCHDSIDPPLYALDVFIPLVDFRQESKCEMDWAQDAPALAKTNGVANRTENLQIEFYRYAKTFYALSGWVLLSLSILTFSGVLQRRDAEE
jgi:hypothetical protein